MEHYIALGDSISISSYPSLDAGLGTRGKVGAADLTGLELVKLGYVKSYFNLAVDGAEITDVYKQIGIITPTERLRPNLISLTAGGNDISFQGMSLHGNPAKFQETMEVITERYMQLVDYLLRTFPNSMLLVNSLYDPTDGTGELPGCGSWSNIAEWYSAGRRLLGNNIRAKYGPDSKRTEIYNSLSMNRILFYDIFKLFDGHGMKTSSPSARWYYSQFMIEPGTIGAREIASAWVTEFQKWFQKQEAQQPRMAFSR